MTAMQTTLADAFEVHGVGLHTGRECHVAVRPAPASIGLRFVRDGRVVPAVASSVADTRRCTCLTADGTTITTVEHLLSALAGCGVDNADVELDGPELPALDGSSATWAAAIRRAGVNSLDAPAAVVRPRAPMAVHLGASWLVALPADEYRVTVATDFRHPMLGAQVESTAISAATYVTEIAPARTFGFIEEVEALLRSGLALGGSLDNALIVYPDRFSDELRVPNECARHKMLDLIGDLALAGCRLQAHIIAVRPGHSANVALAAALADQPKETDACTT